MKIIELNEGEVPFKGCAIYPNLNIIIANIKHSDTSIEQIVQSNFFVKINRDGFDYLIRICNRAASFYPAVFTKNINNVVTDSIIMAEQTKDKYIIDDSILCGVGNGMDIVTYKYKQRYAEI